jgi:hypothetical protein
MCDKLYNIRFACEAEIRHVKEPAPVGERITVFANDRQSMMRPQKENGSTANCLRCPCIKKSGRRSITFFTEEDRQLSRRPTGQAVFCKVISFRELAGYES